MTVSRVCGIPPPGFPAAAVNVGTRRESTRSGQIALRAGLAGGKGVPESVAGHPLVFATFTAPSFGPVHSRPVRRHTCAGKQHCTCKAEPCHPRRNAGKCPHGHPLACYRRHSPGDPRLGEPLCMDCYDYPAHVVWNAAAGELWRRTKQDIERHLIQLAGHRGIPWPAEYLPPVRLSHGKAAEYQARGAVHFHALLRLDGTSRKDPAAIITPPPGITAADLQDAIRLAAATVCFRTRPHPDSPDGEGSSPGARNSTSAPSPTGARTRQMAWLGNHGCQDERQRRPAAPHRRHPSRGNRQGSQARSRARRRKNEQAWQGAYRRAMDADLHQRHRAVARHRGHYR